MPRILDGSYSICIRERNRNRISDNRRDPEHHQEMKFRTLRNNKSVLEFGVNANCAHAADSGHGVWRKDTICWPMGRPSHGLGLNFALGGQGVVSEGSGNDGGHQLGSNPGTLVGAGGVDGNVQHRLDFGHIAAVALHLPQLGVTLLIEETHHNGTAAALTHLLRPAYLKARKLTSNQMCIT